MNLRNVMIASLLAIIAAPAPTIAVARTDVSINLGFGPPPVIVETVPPPRVGYVWAPGYWAWDGHRHAWHGGYWMRDHPGYVWAPHRWEQRGDRWYFNSGRWERHS